MTAWRDLYGHIGSHGRHGREDVSRIARDMGVHIQILSQITRLGATYQTVNQPIEDTAVGKFIVQSLANVAELHRNLNAQNVRNRMKARLQAGYWVFENPPGYVFQSVPGHGRLLVPDYPTANTVREALLGFASGGLGKAPSAGLNRPTSALARFHPVSVRALGFSTPLGMSPGPPSPFGFSAWRMSMILAAGMAVSAPPIATFAASPPAFTHSDRRATECGRKPHDN